MEELGKCPICFEVPEKEVYQCSSGHLICHQCLSKVLKGRCPQCRIPFGPTKIRSRVCEQMLNSKRFECKFKDRGCTHSTERGEITSHANSCSYNPETLALCEKWGSRACNKFRFGCVSRNEVIYHFKETHGIALRSTTGLKIPGCALTTKTGMNMNEASPRMAVRKLRFSLVTPRNEETSPLFLVLGNFSENVENVSFLVVKVWESESQPPKQFSATFTVKKQSDPSIPWPLLPFPIGASMTVCSVKEAGRLMNEFPVNFRVSLLKRSNFGEHVDDHVRVKITEI